MAEGESHFIIPMALLTIRIAQDTMERLYPWIAPEVRVSVDWLGEVVRQLSESAMDSSSMSSIKATPTRLEKVRLMAYLWL